MNNYSSRNKRTNSDHISAAPNRFTGDESYISRIQPGEDGRGIYDAEGQSEDERQLFSDNQSFQKRIPNSAKARGRTPQLDNSLLGSAASNSVTNKSSKRPQIPKNYYHPLSSLAEENQVKNFNQLNPKSKVNEACLQTNKPQRIELPLFFNTPVRANDSSLNQKIKNRSVTSNTCDQLIPIPQEHQLRATKLNYSFNQFGQFATLNKSGIYPKNPIEADEVSKQIIAEKHVYLRSLRRRKDYEILAFACKRAGKPRDEGRSYYSIGVLNDNIGKYKVAIKSYEKFLQICQSIGDSHGEALAYNCLGVDYQMLGEKEKLDQIKSFESYEKAIQYHKLHEGIADVNGKFLACINLGLCFDAIQQKKQALAYYQQALRHSVKMSNIASQTIAIGNIGRIGMSGLLENKEKMTVFIDKYIKLAQDIRDKGGELKGQLKMGQVASLIGDFQAGRDSFLKALEIAENMNEPQMMQDAKCGFAVSNAELQMQDYLLTYAQKMEDQAPRYLKQNFMVNEQQGNKSFHF